MARRSSAPARAQHVTKESGAKIRAEVVRGLFEFLDLNSDGVVEEYEWEVACKEARSFFRGSQSTCGDLTSIFQRLDTLELGALSFGDVKDQGQSLFEAMGLPDGQAVEALQILQERRTKAAQKAGSVGPLDPEAAAALTAECLNADGDEQAQAVTNDAFNRPTDRDTQTMSRMCSDRRAQVLRRFLAVVDPDGDGLNEDMPLAIRAKRAAHQVVTGDVLKPPPSELEAGVAVDALHAGGDSVWVSVELSVCKGRGAGDAAETAPRVPADLLIVVDVSGSMNTALPCVRKCLASLSSLVEDQDRLAVVKFDDRAETVLPWTAMDADGLDKFREAQTELVSRGGTCYLPVLEKCFEELLANDSPGRARSVLFISDGAPMEGDAEIVRAISLKLKAANISIVSAGFGEGTKADLMSAIAQCGCGPFVYIPEASHIPEQLGRIWAAVAHTSLACAFAVLRPLAGARISAVEGAFGAAELSLRPDGKPSSQQALIVQLGSVRYGATREVALQLKLPPHLRGLGKINPIYLRQSLLEVSMISQAIADNNPVYIQRSEFVTQQVPSLLMDTLLPFPVRMVLDNDLEEFDAEVFMKQAAKTFGVQQNELELTRILRGSVIIDMHLKMEPDRACKVLDAMAFPAFQEKMRAAMHELGWKLKSMASPGQQVFRRVLQTRFADALGAAAQASTARSRCAGLSAVQVLAASEVAKCLDPPGARSMAVKVAEDCANVKQRLQSEGHPGQRRHLQHELVQLQAAHVAQYKCESVAASLEVYEQPEGRDAAQVMTLSCGDMSLTNAFWETVSTDVEVIVHDSPRDRLGVMIGLQPAPGKEVDFGHLAPKVCPVFDVDLTLDGQGAGAIHACQAHVVKAASMFTVLRRSCHPSEPESLVDDSVRIPCAQSLKVRVDPRSCCQDATLTFYADALRSRPVKVVRRSLGRNLTRQVPADFWNFTIENSSELWFSFRPSVDRCCGLEWGFQFEVEAVFSDAAPKGLLLQAGFLGVKPGLCSIAARPATRMFEIPSSAIEVRELCGTGVERQAALEALCAAVNASLVTNTAGAQALGFGTEAVRLVSANGAALNGREGLRQLAVIQPLEPDPSLGRVQLAVLTDSSMRNQSCDSLLKAWFKAVPLPVLERLRTVFDAEAPGPRQPEIVSWSWDGNELQLTWRCGWPTGTCALHAGEVSATTVEEDVDPTRLFFMVSPEKQQKTAAGDHCEHQDAEPLRSATFTLPAPSEAVLKLELRLFPPADRPLEDRCRCRAVAWLVPAARAEALRMLTSGARAEDRTVLRGAGACLVASKGVLARAGA